MNYLNYDRNSQPTKFDQNADTNLDEDVNNSRAARYKSSQLEVKKYLQSTLTPHFPNLFDSKFGNGVNSNYINTIDLADILHDGEVLCKLGSLLPASKVPNNPCKSKYKNSKMPFIQMENISFFLSICEAIGLPHDEIFQTVDLYESKDPYQVVITLMSFSRLANNIDSTAFPTVIGPKPVKVKPTIPTKPFKLRS
ncbi:calponin homology domain-containing protein [Scheffersomyces xylosifermentans]|uniref:calponin homology domain-containing protein n=1 Tax=Scheffersomyces xylosifermentans TaxID=1304137 RepID=UPI00315CE234